jgi:hypothetical protein
VAKLSVDGKIDSIVIGPAFRGEATVGLLWATLLGLALECPLNYIKTPFCSFLYDKLSFKQIRREFLFIDNFFL